MHNKIWLPEKRFKAIWWLAMCNLMGGVFFLSHGAAQTSEELDPEEEQDNRGIEDRGVRSVWYRDFANISTDYFSFFGDMQLGASPQPGANGALCVASDACATPFLVATHPFWLTRPSGATRLSRNRSTEAARLSVRNRAETLTASSLVL